MSKKESHQLIECYFVCSHGASLAYPVLVTPKQAKWCKEHGATVYTPEEYRRKIKEVDEKRKQSIKNNSQ